MVPAVSQASDVDRPLPSFFSGLWADDDTVAGLPPVDDDATQVIPAVDATQVMPAVEDATPYPAPAPTPVPAPPRPPQYLDPAYLPEEGEEHLVRPQEPRDRIWLGSAIGALVVLTLGGLVWLSATFMSTPDFLKAPARPASPATSQPGVAPVLASTAPGLAPTQAPTPVEPQYKPAELPLTMTPKVTVFQGDVDDVRPTGVGTSCQDLVGNGFLTTADRAVDGSEATTFACKGDGVGLTIRVTLPSGTQIAEVGLSNRFMDSRALTQVTWIMPDGTQVKQQLNPDDRGIQRMRPGMQAGETLTLRVDASDTGGGVDAVAVPEIVVATPRG